ncbi:MAG: argininosuccinate lyase [Thermodesulfobacteriota bacterium]
MKKKNKKLWAGRFTGKTNALVDAFNSSLGFDFKLAPHDIKGSAAHARVLEKAGVLTASETKKIIGGLKKITKELTTGELDFSSGAEDIHMLIEERLTELIGPLGGKLHTGRSRNDQVALDIKLYLLDEIASILDLLDELQAAFISLAEANIDAIMPGYTHLQRAQPVLFSHHILAYFEMIARDIERFEDCLKRTDEMPLGAGALAGSPYKLDRKFAARLLGFSSVTKNSMDSVSDRDSLIEFTSSAAICMTHLSRLAEELIIWNSSEFGFIEFSDSFSTGSSIMPQKKNPDVAELIRGKTGRVYGNLTTLLTMMKGLPLAYNKDMQEDKEPLFDTVETLKTVLGVLSPMLGKMKVNHKAMLRATKEGFLTATDAADYLVGKGTPFRESHETVGKVVKHCIKKGLTLEDLSVKDWQGFSDLFSNDIKKVVTVTSSIKSRRVYGGTAPAEVRKRLAEVKGK